LITLEEHRNSRYSSGIRGVATRTGASGLHWFIRPRSPVQVRAPLLGPKSFAAAIFGALPTDRYGFPKEIVRSRRGGPVHAGEHRGGPAVGPGGPPARRTRQPLAPGGQGPGSPAGGVRPPPVAAGLGEAGTGPAGHFKRYPGRGVRRLAPPHPGIESRPLADHRRLPLGPGQPGSGRFDHPDCHPQRRWPSPGRGPAAPGRGGRSAIARPGRVWSQCFFGFRDIFRRAIAITKVATDRRSRTL